MWRTQNAVEKKKRFSPRQKKRDEEENIFLETASSTINTKENYRQERSKDPPVK